MCKPIKLLLVILFLYYPAFAQNEPINQDQVKSDINEPRLTDQNGPQKQAPDLGFYFSLGVGFLTGGNQVTLVEESFMLDPDDFEYSILSFDIGSFLFFTQYIGIEATVSKGYIQVEHPDVNDTLDAYTYWKMSPGLVVRYPYVMDSGTIITSSLSGGINYCFLKIDDEYRDLLMARSDSAKGLGYYLQLNFDAFFLEYFFVGIGFQYSYHNVKYSGATKALDGHNIIIPLRAGISF